MQNLLLLIPFNVNDNKFTSPTYYISFVITAINFTYFFLPSGIQLLA